MKTNNQDRFHNFKEGSVHSHKDRMEAIAHAKAGRPTVLTFRGTFGIFGAGDKESFVNSVVEIKGEGRLGSPLAALFHAERLIPMIDSSLLPNSHWLNNITEVKKRISTLCFVRIPITKKAAASLPSTMISYSSEGYPVIQNWFPEGLPVEKITKHLDYPAVTSTNYHGQPEIINTHEVANFCILTNIPLFLKDETYPSHGVRGSYTIFEFHKNGVEAIREGNIPVETFKYIFETEIGYSKTLPPKHPQIKFPTELFENLSPQEVRNALISYAEGRVPRNVKHIRKLIANVK